MPVGQPILMKLKKNNMAQLNEIKNLMSRIGEHVIEKTIFNELYNINNTYSLQTLNEETLSRIINKHGKDGFIIVSANRSGLDNETNNKNTKNLINDLKTSQYGYFPVYGGYHGSDEVTDSFEPSYIVYNHAKEDSSAYLKFKNLYEFGLTLCKKYNQDSVYVQAPDEAPMYVDCNGNKVSGQSSKNFKVNDYAQTFYTTTKREKRSGKDYNDSLITQPQRFTADIQFESMYRRASPSTYFDRMKRCKLGEVFIDK